jgi:ATP-binding cassette subfamily F protein 3
MITVGNLTKSFGSQLLFEGVSFNINPRERVGLVGRNGHGKTTLFRLIVGAESPDAGTISRPKGPPLEGRKNPGRARVFQ